MTIPVKDDLKATILDYIDTCGIKYLSTGDIIKGVKEKIKDATDAKIKYRLMILMGEKSIHGKFSSIWIYWKKRKRTTAARDDSIVTLS